MPGAPSLSDSVPGPRLPPDWQFAGCDTQFRTRIVFGCGVRRRLGEFVGEFGARRVLLVTDAGLVRAGHAGMVLDLLRASGFEASLFDRVLENPDTICVDDCLAVAKASKPDLLLGLGGGSAMDTAKACNFLLTNGGRMQDYRGVGRARLPMLPFIAVPTTAGTGSECQSSALIADAETHLKMACLDPKAAASVAVLDPELTVSLPAVVTACTGIDAIAHAVETAVTLRRNPISEMYSREAFRLLAPSLHQVLADPADLQSRGRMLLGAAFAGMAIEFSMLGAAHSAANPLTAHFGVTHGVAVGLMLPAVIRFNSLDPAVASVYDDLSRFSGFAPPAPGGGDRIGAMVDGLERLMESSGLPCSLAAAGVDRSAIPVLAEEASRQWTASFNPRQVTADDFCRLYAEVFEPRGSRSAGG